MRLSSRAGSFIFLAVIGAKIGRMKEGSSVGIMPRGKSTVSSVQVAMGGTRLAGQSPVTDYESSCLAPSGSYLVCLTAKEKN